MYSFSRTPLFLFNSPSSHGSGIFQFCFIFSTRASDNPCKSTEVTYGWFIWSQWTEGHTSTYVKSRLAGKNPPKHWYLEWLDHHREHDSSVLLLSRQALQFHCGLTISHFPLALLRTWRDMLSSTLFAPFWRASKVVKAANNLKSPKMRDGSAGLRIPSVEGLRFSGW